MLLNSLAINEYKVLRKDALVGKIQRKQSLDRKHVRDERECTLSPFPPPAPHGVINTLQERWLVFQAFDVSISISVAWRAGGVFQARSWVAPINAAALFRHRADTTGLPIKDDVFSCTETTAQGITIWKLEKDASEELLGIPQEKSSCRGGWKLTAIQIL